MSEDARTPTRLRLVRSNPDTHSRAGDDRLHLQPSTRLRKFLNASAAAGLYPADAVRLGLERALALDDACAGFPLDVETARLELRRAAARAKPLRQLSPSQSSYVRALSAGQPKPSGTASEEVLVIALPDRVITRARGELMELALHEGAVEEMIAWEVAATLEGRTMCEWALSTLAAARRIA